MNRRLQRFWVGLWCAFTGYILYGTLFPFSFRYIFLSEQEMYSSLRVLHSFPKTDAGDMLANLLFFIPYGFLSLKILIPYGRFKIWKGALIIISGFGLSFVVEYLQLYTALRITSCVDFLLNGTGAAIGVILGHKSTGMFTQYIAWKKIKASLNTRWSMPALMGLFMLLIESLQPFNVSFQYDFFIQKIYSISNVDPLSFHQTLWLLRYCFVYAIASAFMNAWLFELKVKNYFLGSTVITIGLGIFLELSQTFILSRSPGLFELLAIITGGILGSTAFQIIPSSNKGGLILFWGGVGIVCSVLFSASFSGNMDLDRVNNIDLLMVAGKESLWVSMLINQMTLFIFFGFVVTYMYKESKNPNPEKASKPYNTGLISILALITFFALSTKYFLSFSLYDDLNKYWVPLVSLSMGSALCLWAFVILSDITKRWNSSSE